MAEDFSREYDLFGDPVAAGHGGKGRPEHVPTRENRNKIMLLLALDWKRKDIAAALDITQPTLRKHYFSELRLSRQARARLNATRLKILWDQARQGSVAAVRAFGELMDRLDRTEFARSPAALRKAEPPPQDAGGKKAVLKEAANQPPAEWEDLVGGQTLN